MIASLTLKAKLKKSAFRLTSSHFMKEVWVTIYITENIRYQEQEMTRHSQINLDLIFSTLPRILSLVNHQDSARRLECVKFKTA
jgi:hypothetical protein